MVRTEAKAAAPVEANHLLRPHVKLPNLLSKTCHDKASYSSLRSPASQPVAEPKLDKAWYESLLSFDPWACFRQLPADRNKLGELVKGMLASCDSSALGVKVELGTLKIDPAIGRIKVQGLTVRNPEGWNSEYLLHADKIIVDLDMEKLLLSFGKELHLEELVFDGVDVIYEKSLTSSNLHDLLARLDTGAAQTEKGKALDAVEIESARHCRQSWCCCGGRADNDPDVKLVLHTVMAHNVGAKFATKLTHGHGPRLEVGDLKYDDFDAEMGPGHALIAIIHILIATLIKSVLADIVGKHNAETIVHAADAVKDKLSSLEHRSVEAVRKGCSKISSLEQGSVESVRKGCSKIRERWTQEHSI